MNAPDTIPTPTTSATQQTREAQVVVHRPDPGLARGMWEAPPWLFLVAVLLLAATLGLYVAHRAGKLRWKSREGDGQIR